jgi:hypothetical protein
MADPILPDNTPVPAAQRVRTSSRLWSDIVGEAEADAGITQPRTVEPGYVWSGGKRFNSGKGGYE